MHPCLPACAGQLRWCGARPRSNVVMSTPSRRRLRASAAHLQQPNPSAAATDELTPEELAAWRRNGCLIVRQLFTGAPHKI